MRLPPRRSTLRAIAGITALRRAEDGCRSSSIGIRGRTVVNRPASGVPLIKPHCIGDSAHIRLCTRNSPLIDVAHNLGVKRAARTAKCVEIQLIQFKCSVSLAADLLPQEKRLEYELPVIKKWLDVFLFRFFKISQFKRSAIPNGPKVGSGGSLSPRGDWRAPSDSEADVWLSELGENVPG